ncbi:hypothetical protein FJZ31_25475 [Candidatus Poribacteria bacterium]|nr:hypothetical protein [Candidatus Poribacteria bacterium]
MKKKNPSLKDWIPIVDEIYKHGRTQGLMICPYCQNKSVKFTIQTYKEGDATIFLECLNCKIFDHISRIPIPDWLKEDNLLNAYV